MMVGLHPLKYQHPAFLRDSIAGEEFNYGMWFFLRVLYEEDGLTQKELSERVGMMQPTAVTAIKNMQSRGLVRVENDETDRRRTYIHLTPAGKRVGKRMLPLLRQINDVALQGITKIEFDTLRTVLRKIRSNVDKARFGVSTANAIRWRSRHKEVGDIVPQRQGGDRKSQRIEAHSQLILDAVTAKPDITLAELRDMLRRRGISAGIASLRRFFQRRKITLKKDSARCRATTRRYKCCA
jgi:DNA-binding MarR family transcriptional regulator